MQKARQRENSKGFFFLFFFFPSDCVRMIRLIVCKSCTMNVKLQLNHINELSVAWSKLLRKELSSPVLRAVLISA